MVETHFKIKVHLQKESGSLEQQLCTRLNITNANSHDSVHGFKNTSRTQPAVPRVQVKAVSYTSSLDPSSFNMDGVKMKTALWSHKSNICNVLWTNEQWDCQTCSEVSTSDGMEEHHGTTQQHVLPSRPCLFQGRTLHISVKPHIRQYGFTVEEWVLNWPAGVSPAETSGASWNKEHNKQDRGESSSYDPLWDNSGTTSATGPAAALLTSHTFMDCCWNSGDATQQQTWHVGAIE